MGNWEDATRKLIEKIKKSVETPAGPSEADANEKASSASTRSQKTPVKRVGDFIVPAEKYYIAGEE